MAFQALEWRDKEVVNAAKKVLKETSKEVAENVMADAKQILKRKATTTTEKGLLDQFSIKKSKFDDTGYLVYCQGPSKWWPPYHASFLEMGTFKDIAKPFMRPAGKKNKSKAKRMYQEALGKL